MNPNSNFIISNRKKEAKSDIARIIWVVIQLLIVAAVIVGIIIALNDVGLADEDYVADVYAICQPGDFVNVRATPKKNGEVVGRFDCGDKLRTDWETQNGYLHVFVSLEVDEAWIHLGYVSAWEPEWKAGEMMTVSAEGRVACRRWCDGPRIDGRAGWVQPGTTVQVFYWTPEWAVTNRGYLRSEYLGDGAQ